MQNLKRQRPVDKMHIMRSKTTQTKFAMYMGPFVESTKGILLTN